MAPINTIPTNTELQVNWVDEDKADMETRDKADTGTRDKAGTETRAKADMETKADTTTTRKANHLPGHVAKLLPFASFVQHRTELLRLDI